MRVALTREEAEREGAERLNPRLSNPSWLVLRKRRELFRKWIAALPGSGLKVLDIGGRIQPYRPLLADRVDRYFAIDIRQSPLVDVIANGECLPFPNDQMDLVICTQVLEYVVKPDVLIEEIHRVLKPEGILLLSAPMLFPIDSEQDLWRFTSGGVHRLLSRFSHVEVRGEGSSVEGLFRTIAVWIVFFARPSLIAWLLTRTVIPFLNVGARLLSRALSSNNEQFSANFSALARK